MRIILLKCFNSTKGSRLYSPMVDAQILSISYFKFLSFSITISIRKTLLKVFQMLLQLLGDRSQKGYLI